MLESRFLHDRWAMLVQPADIHYKASIKALSSSAGQAIPLQACHIKLMLSWDCLCVRQRVKYAFTVIESVPQDSNHELISKQNFFKAFQ